MKKNSLNISSISEGFVLDHIPAGLSMDIYRYLKLDKMDCCVAIIKNVASKKMGKKDIIKIDADIAIDIDVIGYVDPGTTVNVIKNCRLVEKRTLELPQMLTNVIKCKNPRCITSTEQEINHVFKLTDKDNGVYRCIYCETQAK